MSATKSCQPVRGTEPPSARETGLPVDLLLEIVARTDVTTVVRSAATCRFFRRAILDPAFRSRLALQLAVDPALLLGFSYQEFDRMRTAYRVVQTPAPNQVRARLHAGSHRDWFRPMASRDRLLLLGRYGHSHEDLRVCDVLTGHVTDLPPAVYVTEACGHVFLYVSDGGGDAAASFELLVMDGMMRFQIFSAKEGTWGAISQTQASFPAQRHPDPGNHLCTSRPAVIGRTVYWSCSTSGSDFWDKIVALDVDAAKVTMMDLPPVRFVKVVLDGNNDSLLLASVRGRLSLFVSDLHEIAMWTLTPASSGSPATWSRPMVIGVPEIQRQVGNLVCAPFKLVEFGERSGTVIFHLHSGELFRLDLGIKEETPVVRRIKSRRIACVTDWFLHETDLISLLQAMKSV